MCRFLNLHRAKLRAQPEARDACLAIEDAIGKAGHAEHLQSESDHPLTAGGPTPAAAQAARGASLVGASKLRVMFVLSTRLSFCGGFRAPGNHRAAPGAATSIAYL